MLRKDEKNSKGTRFHIAGLGNCHPGVVQQIKDRVKKTFHGCALEYSSSLDVGWDHTKGPSAYIIVTDQAQTFVDSRGYLGHRIRLFFLDKNACLFTLSICFLLLFIYLLVNHTWGYRDPLKNIKSYVGV